MEELLKQLPAPAQRALANAGIKTLDDLARFPEAKLKELHGIGPSSLPPLREALHIHLVRAFLRALSDGKSGEALSEFYHPQAQQTEFPNLLTKVTTVRGLQDLKVASERGKAVIRKQDYQLVKVFSTHDAVVIEAVWTAELAIPLGKIKPGDEMKAYFAQFYEFQDGKILAQRNYDCFENFM